MFNLIISFFLSGLLLKASELCGNPKPKGDGWFCPNNTVDSQQTSCFKIIKTNSLWSWPEADEQCQKRYNNHMATIKSMPEQDAVLAAMAKENCGMAWFGMHNILGRESYEWADGTPVGDNDWRRWQNRNEPNSFNRRASVGWIDHLHGDMLKGCSYDHWGDGDILSEKHDCAVCQTKFQNGKIAIEPNYEFIKEANVNEKQILAKKAEDLKLKEAKRQKERQEREKDQQQQQPKSDTQKQKQEKQRQEKQRQERSKRIKVEEDMIKVNKAMEEKDEIINDINVESTENSFNWFDWKIIIIIIGLGGGIYAIYMLTRPQKKRSIWDENRARKGIKHVL